MYKPLPPCSVIKQHTFGMNFVFASHHLILLFISLSIFLVHCLGKCHVDDETGLLDFKSGITQDPYGLLSSWKAGTDCCSWVGVSCLANNRVNSVSVNGQQHKPKAFLTGTISPSLSKLWYLDGIFLLNLRNITGTFPTFIYGLPNLQSLFLDNNHLSGPIPVDIGNRLYKLGVLSLSANRFTGSIPNSFARLTRLTQLNLGENALTGPIPDGIRMLKNLTYLNLEKNQLSGKIPDYFATFSDLWTLKLSRNKFRGEIPASISTLPKLAILELGHNALSGKLPDEIGSFRVLETLDLSSNELSGQVPSSLNNLTKILDLNLAHNQLEDPFPQLNGKRLLLLDLSHNKFKLGQIPEWVASDQTIFSLKLAGCGLKFGLEKFKTEHTYFYDFLDLSDNQISGSAVQFLNQSLYLNEFRVSGNQLHFNMSNLIIHQSLKYLDLSRNQVFGEVPKSISGLEKVDLSNNHLCGPIPATKFSAQAFQGNDCLCGSPLPPC